MRIQRVLLGELVIDGESPIELRAELPSAEVREKAAVLKDRLAYLLDTRFRPADPEPFPLHDLTVEDVAGLLHCSCRIVLQMVKRGKLHPFSDENGEPYFQREEVALVAHLPLGHGLSRIVPRN
jgi:hypothetical protein